MAFFRRKQTDTVLPEVDRYYEGEKRDRAGLAWLLALVSILVVAAIIAGLFLSGRWAYNKLVKDDPNTPVAVSDQSDEPSVDGGPATNDSRADQDTNTPTENSGDTEVAAPTTPVAPTAPAPSDNNASNSNSSTQNLPNTGPAGIITVFAGVTTVATTASMLVERRKLRR